MYLFEYLVYNEDSKFYAEMFKKTVDQVFEKKYL